MSSRIALVRNPRGGGKPTVHSYPRPAETVAIGPYLLVHPGLKRNGFSTRSWSLTHRPSGLAIAVGLCCKPSAVGLAKALKVHNWNFRHTYGTKPALPEGFDQKTVQDIMRDWICPFGCETANPVPRPARSG